MQTARNNSYYYSPRFNGFPKSSTLNIRPLFKHSLNDINKVNRDLGLILKACIKQKYSLLKFEKVCLEHDFKFSRRTLNGLISGERSDFRLSYFACLFHILNLNFVEVLREYMLLDENQLSLNTETDTSFIVENLHSLGLFQINT